MDSLLQEPLRFVGIVLMVVAVIELGLWRVLGNNPQFAKVQPVLLMATVASATIGLVLFLIG